MLLTPQTALRILRSSDGEVYLSFFKMEEGGGGGGGGQKKVLQSETESLSFVPVVFRYGTALCL